MSALVHGLTIASAVTTAVAAGVFFTFSTFTMEGLKRLAPSDAAAAMQAINREAPTPPFMTLFLGTGAACLVLLALTAFDLGAPGATMRAAACVLYLLGAVAMTVGYHVPRNDRLEALDPGSSEAAAYWAVYLREWVPVNHVRTVAPAIASLLLILSLRAA